MYNKIVVKGCPECADSTRQRLKARCLVPQTEPDAVIYAALKGVKLCRSITNSHGGDDQELVNSQSGLVQINSQKTRFYHQGRTKGSSIKKLSEIGQA